MFSTKNTLPLALLAIILSFFHTMDISHHSIWHFLDAHINCCPCYNVELLNPSFSNLFSGDLPDIDIDLSGSDDFDLDTSEELEDTDLPMPGVRCPRCLEVGIEQ